MNCDDKRFYTFVFAPTASSQLRKFNVPHKVLYAVLGLAVVGFFTVGWGAFLLTKQTILIAKVRLLEQKNRILVEENQEYNSKKELLLSRLAVLDTTQRKLADNSGVNRISDISQTIGRGGPAKTDVVDIEKATASLEAELLKIKDVVDKNTVRLASTPSGWPVRGYVTDGFGNRRNPFGGAGRENHAGIDIATNHGTAIEATADGIVIFAGPYGGYGNVVVIDHGYGLTTRYAHMSRIIADVGKHVTRGKVIGEVGSTGRSTAPHCHYEVRLQDRPVNPLNYMNVGRQ